MKGDDKMDFHQFEYVIAIAEEKSISKAAKALYISQPSLSQYIIRLEKKLGLKLFDRKGNNITLTYAGEKYLKTAKNILKLKEQLKNELSDIKGSKKGCLTIGVPNQVGRYVLPQVLPKFNKRFPEIELIVKEDVTAKLEEMLIAGTIDIAILYLPIKDEKIIFEPVLSERIFLVAPKDHAICSNTNNNSKLYFNELKSEKFILLKKEQRMRLIADEIFEKSKVTPTILLELESLDTAHRVAASGMGFTFVPENVIWLLNSNSYKNYFYVHDMINTIVIAYRANEYINNITREFIKITKDVMKSNKKMMKSNREYKEIYINKKMR